jgi:putative DNA primase/helicase
MNNLSSDHLADLQKSGLSGDTIDNAGIYTVPLGQINKIFGWDIPIDSLLAFPYRGTSFVRYKLFPPYKKKGETRAQKYYQKSDTFPHLYFPSNFDCNADAILFTEGEKKALKAVQEGINCIGLGGIWNFAVRDKSGNPRLIDDFDSIEWIDKQVEIVPDFDFQKKLEVKQAVYRLGTMLEKRGANVSVVCLPTAGSEGKLDDYLCGHSIDEFKKLKRVPLKHKLFSEVKKREEKAGKEPEKKIEKQLIVEDVELWPEPINPAMLLTDIATTIQRFIVCNEEIANAVALWIAMTWFIDVVQVAPLAVITAPEKRCGKSLLLSLLGRLSASAITASSISPASLYRTIEAWQPTLLIDEVDTFMKNNEELRGLINSGHTRDSAYVIRTVGDNFTPTKFSTWGAKALSGIGHVADTLMDRAVILELRRKLPHEKVERIRNAAPGLFDELRSKLARFAEDYSEKVRQARPPLPSSLNDREQDNWEPLLQIAMAAGDEWLKIGINAALKLSGGESVSQTSGTELLSDIQEILNKKKVDRITTEDLIKALCIDGEKPWLTYNRGLSISPRQLASKLKGYGIHSKSIRISDTETPKGFERNQFEDAFSRYLTPSPENIRHTPQPAPVQDLRGFKSATDGSDVADKNWRNQPILKQCCGVADKKGGTHQQTEIFLNGSANLREVEI